LLGKETLGGRKSGGLRKIGKEELVGVPSMPDLMFLSKGRIEGTKKEGA